MKISIIVCAVCMALAIQQGCGGASSVGDNAIPGSSSEIAQLASDSFFSISADARLSLCLYGQELSCDCPGGGTISSEGGEPGYSYTVLFENCKIGDEKIYSGSVTYSDIGIYLRMDEFGGCTDMVGYPFDVTGCSGEYTGSCGGEEVSCSCITDDNDRCVCSCS